MNMERFAMKGQLSDERSKVSQLEFEAAGLIASIRTQLSPFIPVVEVKIAEASASMDRLKEVLGKIKDKQKLIKQLEDALGE